LTKNYRLLKWEFTVTYINPCRTAVVTPRVINNMSVTVGNGLTVSQVYTDFTDSVSTLFGNGYDSCGPRSHYLATQVNNNENVLTPDALF